KLYKLPQTLFQLLDAIQPGNNKTLIKLFHQTIDTTETEMVFFMLIRQFRILLGIKPVQPQGLNSFEPQGNNLIDELKRMQPWQKTKLEQQANKFELSHLLNLYDKLFQIEVGQKTGGLTSPLVSTIDF